MGIREKISKQPAVVGIVAVLVAIGAVAYSFRSMSPRNPYDSAFFTTDDGASTFTDSMDRIPPFDHHGSPAVRAWMFTCDGGKTKFVAYLERYTPEAKTKMEAALADYKSGKSHIAPSPGPNSTEVKKPQSNSPWVSQSDYQIAGQITNVKCASGIAELSLP